jgi:hypothetical protein
VRPAAELDGPSGPVQSRTMPARRDLVDRTALRNLPLITLLAACGAYVWSYLYRGWFGHDDGALAQMAERVLAGEDVRWST